MDLYTRIEQALSELKQEDIRIENRQQAFGGCIHNSQSLRLSDGSQYFVKNHPQADLYPGLFAAEFKALSLIYQTRTIRVPEPILYEDDFILMEYFQQGEKSNRWHEEIGQRLAQMHLKTQTDEYGFDEDNYLGTSKQINSKTQNWLEFWCENRLAYQLNLFSKKAGNDVLIKKGYKLVDNLDAILEAIEEPPVLLHGDLWSGNASADELGAPIIFDPASYYGHREAEIGMMRMFGGFGPRVEAAYEEIWPLQDGSERRIRLYRLYHELNHLNLFGGAYYTACLSSIDSLL